MGFPLIAEVDGQDRFSNLYRKVDSSNTWDDRQLLDNP